MLGDLPHEGFADLQLYRLLAESPPLDLEPLGLNTIEPVIRAMHSYPVGYPLAYLLEGALGEGGLILSALDLDPSLPEGRYLLASICAYAVSDAFNPATELSEAAVEALAVNTSLP